MISKIIISLVKTIAVLYGIDWKVLCAFIEIETGGIGFDTKTGKLIIQFEPKWFKRLTPYAPSGKWTLNKVDVQSKEWEAFNDAFSKNKETAMESTSIGIGQIMGFHWKRLGYSSVGAMWDDAKKGLDRQIYQIIKFIITDKDLYIHIKDKDWHGIATIYNGAKYKEMAIVWGREPYNISMEKAYNNYVQYEKGQKSI